MSLRIIKLIFLNLFHSDIFRSNKLILNFQQLIDNLFRPLFEATNDPKNHPELHWFLQRVNNNLKTEFFDIFIYFYVSQLVGFDSVDDESKPEHPVFDREVPTPEKWTDEEYV